MDKSELELLKEKRKEKFGAGGKSTTLSNEDQAKLEERKKKFLKSAVDSSLTN